jgi:hypothetical protein
MPNSAVVSPNLGLYFDRPAISLNPRMLQNGMNFRIKNGKISNISLGWERFDNFQLNGPVTLINNFFLRDGTEQLIFGTPTDIYRYVANTHQVLYLTPIYAVGTASASGTTVTGAGGTEWATNVKDGDEISFGSATENDPEATWYTISHVTDDDTLTISATAGTVVDGPYTIRKKFSSGVSDIWSTAVFLNAQPANEDQWYATNGVDDVVRWNGVDTQLTVMSCLGFKAKVLATFSNMMIYANLVQDGQNKPTDIINSDVGQPANVAGGLSEQFKVLNSEYEAGIDAIVNAVPLGDNLILYAKNSVVAAQFVGSDLVFIFRVAMTNAGLLSPKLIADSGSFHEFVGKVTQYHFDGVTVKEQNSHVWKEILRTQDPTRVHLGYSHFDDQNGELVWIVPSTTDAGAGDGESPPAKAWTEHYLEEVGQNPTPFSTRTFPFTATGYYSRQAGLTWDQLVNKWNEYNFRWNDQFFFASFPLNLGGTTDGKIYSINTAQNADGAALPSFAHFGRRAVADGRMRGLITRIYPFMTPQPNNVNVSVSILMADHAMGNATITDTQTFDQTLPEEGHFTTHYRRGRFWELKISSSLVSQPWEMSGYDYDVRAGGRR